MRVEIESLLVVCLIVSYQETNILTLECIKSWDLVFATGRRYLHRQRANPFHGKSLPQVLGECCESCFMVYVQPLVSRCLVPVLLLLPVRVVISRHFLVRHHKFSIESNAQCQPLERSLVLRHLRNLDKKFPRFIQHCPRRFFKTAAP